MASTSYVHDSSIACEKYIPIPEGKTFWDEGHYETVVRRLENGKRSINDFLFMVEERAAIERRYADKLQSWHKKWSTAVKQGPEFGEIETIWQSILTEGRKIADIHFKLSSSLGLTSSDGIQKKVYRFKKTYYHKLPLQKELKEAKECRESFKSIQAPYKKALENINKLKKRYFDTSKNYIQFESKVKRGSNADSQQHQKLGSIGEAKEKAKYKYLEALNSFNDNIRDTYSQSMRDEFQHCQEFESERLTLLLNSLHDFIGIVNQQTHTKEPLSSIYSQAVFPLNTAKPEKNLNYFAKMFGAAMPHNFPKFEDTDQEPVKSRLVSGAAASGPFLGQLKGPNMILSRLKHLRSEGVLRSTPTSSTKNFMLKRPSLAESLNSASVRNSEFKDIHYAIQPKRSFDSAMISGRNSKASSDDMAPQGATSDHYEMRNVYVRAISNFKATQRDHLDISKGEVIYQIRGNENGWCYGRIAFKEGIYPSDAVKLLTMNLFTL